jgi:type I restriction-modification system DNA methylase subunit
LKPNTNLFYQPSFFDAPQLTAAVEDMAVAGVEERGAIFTRPEVVDFILDLAGYTVDQPLHQRRLLEPSFGGGDFLLAAAKRLFAAYRKRDGSDAAHELRDAIRGVELHRDTFLTTNARLKAELREAGLSIADAESLAHAWLTQGDFLLADLPGVFDFVVGNPPYVRQETIPDVLIAEYRRRYATVYDRADIYVPFIERSLAYLKPGGVLGFICADRWMKNKYGGPLRQMIADRYHLRTFVDMVDTPAFLSDVIAYPGIFIIGNERGT